MADGLASAFGEDEGQKIVAQITGKPPKDENEVAERKASWKGVLDSINNDPNMLRALMATGFSLMQPGANFGSSALQGMATYEAGKQSDLAQQKAAKQEERLTAQEARSQEAHDVSMQDRKADVEFQAKRRPLELQSLQAQIDAMPDKREAAKLELAMKRLELEQAPEKLRLERLRIQAAINASNRAGASAARESDQERAIQSYMQVPEIAALPPAQQRAAATQKYIRDLRGTSTDVKNEYADEKAVSYYNFIEGLEPETKSQTLMLMDANGQMLYARGKQLAEGAPTQGKSAVSEPSGAQQTPQVQPASKPISAADIRKALQAGAKQEVKGTIR